MAPRNRAIPPPTTAGLVAHYAERIGEPMPLGLIPADLELLWLGQLLFGTAAALEHPYRVQPDVEDFLRDAPEGHFAIGFWGHGMQSHAFYVQRVESWCRVYLRIPYGGVYSDHEDQALKLHRVLLWLPEFLREARSRCRHLRLVDSMGDAQLKLESIDGDEAFFRCSADQMARKDARVSDLLEVQSNLQLERWLTQ
ncbi:hypothetical protein KBY83_02705 [Cyanobium sp. WKJ7-Wakatipu]|uniref:hypothetical protein n=1 Tax=Cyanobium sp. WKJ7-Wakatipu TaxID=2823726 RepID=UPI0020CDC392|nr:hypothetical protein [Cyanobium sp. WKJ7-Wakatipu]MCP9782231.1 hypothetical protein [Cyanobium sp. WKJ7-Wakatipu]